MRRRSRAGGDTAKLQRHKAVTPKRRSAPESVGTRGSSVAGQETEVARLTRERDEAREQQAATVEILGLISNSPTDTLPVFKTILAKAVELCEASFWCDVARRRQRISDCSDARRPTTALCRAVA